LTLGHVFLAFFQRNTYYYTMSYDDEHPLVIAMAWFLSGAAFGVFILAKMGVLNTSADNNHVSSEIELYEYNDISIYNQEAD
jgi:hypothetical protein